MCSFPTTVGPQTKLLGVFPASSMHSIIFSETQSAPHNHPHSSEHRLRMHPWGCQCAAAQLLGLGPTQPGPGWAQIRESLSLLRMSASMPTDSCLALGALYMLGHRKSTRVWERKIFHIPWHSDSAPGPGETYEYVQRTHKRVFLVAMSWIANAWKLAKYQSEVDWTNKSRYVIKIQCKQTRATCTQYISS